MAAASNRQSTNEEFSCGELEEASSSGGDYHLDANQSSSGSGSGSYIKNNASSNNNNNNNSNNSKGRTKTIYHQRVTATPSNTSAMASGILALKNKLISRSSSTKNYTRKVSEWEGKTRLDRFENLKTAEHSKNKRVVHLPHFDHLVFSFVLFCFADILRLSVRVQLLRPPRVLLDDGQNLLQQRCRHQKYFRGDGGDGGRWRRRRRRKFWHSWRAHSRRTNFNNEITSTSAKNLGGDRGGDRGG